MNKFISHYFTTLFIIIKRISERLAYVRSIFKETIKKNYSVRQVEDIVREYQEKGKSKLKESELKTLRIPLTPSLQKVQDDLASYLGTKVVLKDKTAGKGELIISYYSTDDLNRILGLIEEE